MNDTGFTRDRAASIEWARNFLDPQRLQRQWVILDTETTGLDAGGDTAIQIGVIDRTGRTLLDALIYPEVEIDPGAQAIHGLTRRDLLQAAPFHAVYPALAAILARSRCLVYNAGFDQGILSAQCDLHRLPMLPGARAHKRNEYDTYPWEDIMEPYAAYRGKWSNHHGSYRWQKLPGGDHTAIGDCRAALAVLHEMAAAGADKEGHDAGCLV